MTTLTTYRLEHFTEKGLHRFGQVQAVTASAALKDVLGAALTWQIEQRPGDYAVAVNLDSPEADAACIVAEAVAR